MANKTSGSQVHNHKVLYGFLGAFTILIGAYLFVTIKNAELEYDPGKDKTAVKKSSLSVNVTGPVAGKKVGSAATLAVSGSVSSSATIMVKVMCGSAVPWANATVKADNTWTASVPMKDCAGASANSDISVVAMADDGKGGEPVMSAPVIVKK